ncbi:hypothetical protein P280DRAFT_177442 [Massarina eburnea CBS 473.64]|uniref:Uncharacterized protein n=1 Tax=Massarina eburnea CBS 473.64 TaxID=1395130 RepID=A0A6A6SD77_9PLEO|nr:hypothetical protein P280DRAFT_177442 [Massarina eburnea CBS 473.64]
MGLRGMVAWGPGRDCAYDSVASTDEFTIAEPAGQLGAVSDDRSEADCSVLARTSRIIYQVGPGGVSGSCQADVKGRGTSPSPSPANFIPLISFRVIPSRPCQATNRTGHNRCNPIMFRFTVLAQHMPWHNSAFMRIRRPRLAGAEFRSTITWRMADGGLSGETGTRVHTCCIPDFQPAFGPRLTNSSHRSRLRHIQVPTFGD